MKDFTEKEMKCIKSLESILKKKPKSLEIVAKHGHVCIYNTGAMDKAFENDGDCDHVDIYADKAYIIERSGIIPNSESM